MTPPSNKSSWHPADDANQKSVSLGTGQATASHMDASGRAVLCRCHLADGPHDPFATPAHPPIDPAEWARAMSPVELNPSALCWHPDGWECASEYSVQDPTRVTRPEAIARFCHEVSEPWVDVRVYKRHARALTIQEQWEDRGMDEWVWNMDPDGLIEDPQPPDVAPLDWTADDEAPAWELCHRSHAEATPIWVCILKGQRIPASPEAPR